MFQKVKKALNIGQSKNDVNGENAKLTLYRNTKNISGKYYVKFLAPSIVKDKIAFKLPFSTNLNTNVDFYNDYVNMMNNLILPVDIITIFSKGDDDINEYKSWVMSLQENKDKWEQYRQILFNQLDNLKGATISESYFLVDKKLKEKSISFFNKYEFTVEYAGEAEIVLEKNTFTEEEYIQQVKLNNQINDLDEE